MGKKIKNLVFKEITMKNKNDTIYPKLGWYFFLQFVQQTLCISKMVHS